MKHARARPVPSTDDEVPDPMLSRNRIVILAAAFVAVVCLSLVLLDGWRSFTSRNIQLREGRTAAENLSKSLAQHANDAFSQVDTVLFNMVDRVEAGGASEDAMYGVHDFVVHQVRERLEIQRLAVIDASGRWVTTSLPSTRIDVDHDNHDYLEYHLNHASRASHVGKPIRSWSTNQWILPISRRFNYPDGSFAGVVVVAFDLDYFNRYYGRFDIGQKGAIALITFDGVILDRRPFKENLLGTKVTGNPLFKLFSEDHNAGSMTVISPIDGVERLAAYKSADDFPVFVNVALSTEELLQPWKSDAVVHTAGVWLLALALGFVGYRLVGQITRRTLVERDLSASKAQLETLNKRLEVLAAVDGMTGLANRREFDRMLVEERSRSDRAGTPLALIMIDVDHFKGYNDRYGHPQGDECLKQVAGAIHASTRRPNDLAARYGGEEFVVVLPSTDMAGAVYVAEKIRVAVSALRLEHSGCARGFVTVSVGVSCFGRDDVDKADAQLVAEADAALYVAKRSGRNVVSGQPRGICVAA